MNNFTLFMVAYTISFITHSCLILVMSGGPGA
jgi:hypothetical protein